MRLGDTGQFAGDPPHRGLGLLTRHRTAQPQLGGDRAGSLTRRATPITHPGTGGSTRGLDTRDRARHRPRPPWPTTPNRSDRPPQPPPRWCRRGPCQCAAVCAGRLGQQRLVQPSDRGVPAAAWSVSSTSSDAAPSSPTVSDKTAARKSNRHLSAQRLIAQPVAELQEHQPQIGLHRDRRPTDPGIEVRHERRKNTGSSSSASTRANSPGNTNNSDGKIASHNVGWSFTVLNTMASIPSSPRVRGHHLVQTRPQPQAPPRPDFFRSK